MKRDAKKITVSPEQHIRANAVERKAVELIAQHYACSMSEAVRLCIREKAEELALWTPARKEVMEALDA